MICAANGLPCFKDLIAVLFECFSIISLGYLSCRFKLVSSQAKDLNSYLTNLALPMIIFLNIAQMEFQTINLSFLLCVLAAKLLVFLTVTLLTLTISYPTNFGYAGSLSILATQSNDFALGYPLIKLLYGESKPEMLNYLSLMAPIQLLILNPLGIAMLEFQKSKNNRKLCSDNADTAAASSGSKPSCRLCKQGVKSTAHGSVPMDSFSPQESIKGDSPTRLLEVAGLMQTSRSLHASRHSSKPPSPTICSKSAPTSGTMIAPRSAPSNDEGTGRVKFRRKNVRSLVLALPARDVLNREGTQLSRCGSEMSTNLFAALEEHSDNSTGEDYANERAAIRTKGHERFGVPSSSAPDFDHEIYTTTPERNDAITVGAGRNNSLGTKQLVDIEPADKLCQCQIKDSSITSARTKSELNLSFFKALATNPLILASIIALLVNLIHGPELPKYITRVSNTIAASFAAPALFVVGLSMYGKFELLLRNPRDLLLSSVMVLTKGLVLPSLLRTIALFVVPSFAAPADVPDLVDFAFLYGLLPTAPTACIIAKQYGVLQNVVSISMLLSTIMAGPLTLASSVIISPSSVISVNDIESVICQTMEVSALVTLLLTPFSLYTFLKSTRSLVYRDLLHASSSSARRSIKRLLRANPIRVFVMLLALSQIMIGVGGILWFFIDTTELNNSIDPSYTQKHPSIVSNSKAFPSLSESGGSDLEVSGLPSAVESAGEPANVPNSMVESHIPATMSHAIRTLSPRRSWLANNHMDLGYKTLSSLRYVLAAGGLMMAQFSILCLLIVMTATKFKSRSTALRVSELSIKACLSALVCLIVWLAIDSEHLVHLPVEASLPSSAESLFVRLVYNVFVLTITLPLYAILIRADNQARKSRLKLDKTQNEIGVQASEVDMEVHTFAKRRFVTSSSSLSSDASSAVTSNTNLESSMSSGQCANLSADVSNQHQAHTADSLSIILDAKLNNADTHQRPVSPVEVFATNPDAHIFGATSATTINQSNQSELDAARDIEKSPTSDDKLLLDVNEFNGYYILIVFMLINSTLNLFSVAQKLLHEEPVGTFRQIEIIGVAFEFGQGLLTFLVYGRKGIFGLGFCKGDGNMS